MTISFVCFRRPGRLALAVLLLLLATPANQVSAQSPGGAPPPAEESIKAVWTRMPGLARDIAINAAAFAYAVDPQGVALRWRADGQKWAKMSGAFVRIAAAEGNRPWAVNADGVVMRFNGLWWEPKGDKVVDVAGDAVGNVFVVRAGGAIERFEPLSGDWRPVPGPPALRITLDLRGNPWIIATDGRIFRRANNDWVEMPGRARDIAVGADGAASIVDVDGRLRGLRVNPLRWVLYSPIQDPPGTPAPPALAVAVTPTGGPWAVLANGAVYATTLIQSQAPITEETPKSPTPKAAVPQAPQAQAPKAVAPKIQPQQAQAGQDKPRDDKAPDARAPNAKAQPLGSQGSGNKKKNQSDSVSPSTGGGLGDQAAVTQADELKFVDTRGTASHIAIGRDGSVFALDTSGNIARWSNSRSAFESFPGSLARIAVDSLGNPWGVTGLGRVFRHDGLAWQQIQGVTGSDISINGRTDIVILSNAEGLLSRYDKTTGKFDRIDGLGVQVAAAPDGTPWVIGSDHVVKRCARNPCTPVSQLARSISIGPDGSIYLVSTNDQLMRKRPKDAFFSQVMVPGHTPAAVAVGPKGFPWVVTSARKVLASQFFPRDESADRVLAQKSSGGTTGSGATGQVAASESSSAFTFTKNIKWQKYKSSDPDANIAMLSDIHAGHTGAIYITGDSKVFKFNTKNSKFETLTKDFSISSFADVGEDESGTLWALYGIAPATVYRIKNNAEKSYTVISSTDTNTPRNMAVTADGTVYVAVGTQLYKMEAGASVFKKIVDDDVYNVHVGPGGDIWILNQSFEVQQYTGSKFENRPKGTALKATDLAVGADGSVYALKQSDGLLKKWNASNSRFDDVNITQDMQKVTVTIEGRPWIINTSGLAGLPDGDIWRAKD